MPDAEPGLGPGAQIGAALLDLVAVMDRLRRECPWDAKQTHLSLAPHLLEETYEALEALEQQDPAALREELGDVLLQVLFHARMAAERTDGTGFTIDDVAAGIAAKLIRRHPHVFADVSVSGADEVKRNWEQIKRAERAGRAGQAGQEVSVLDGVPMGQPALSLAAQLLRRAGAAGAPAELAELPVSGLPLSSQSASGLPVSGQSVSGLPVSGQSVSGQSGQPAGPEDGTQAGTGTMSAADAVSAVGAELFAVVAKARASGLDPELELRHAARVYRDRVRDWEQQQSG